MIRRYDSEWELSMSKQRRVHVEQTTWIRWAVSARELDQWSRKDSEDLKSSYV
jgi:hypothetical protein